MEISYLKSKYPILRKFFSRIIPLGSFLLICFLLGAIIAYFFGYKNISYYLAGLFVILYVWWLIRGFEYVILVLGGILRYKFFKKLNLKNIFNLTPSSKKEHIYVNKYKKSDLKKEDLFHWVIIPTYQDPLEMLKDTIESLKNSDYDNKKILVTIAGEYPDKDNFEIIKKEIVKLYGNVFGSLNFTLHKLNYGELPGKGSNVTFAANSSYNKILKFAPSDKILVHIMDSESIVDKNYFLSMALEYCLTSAELRHKTIYQPMLFLLNRFFQAPYFSKVIALSVGVYILGASIKGVGVRAQAVQAQSLKSLLLTNFYSVETITEDGHQYYRTYCAFNGNFQVKPVYTYVLLEPVIGKTIWETFKLQYKQILRWAHGCLDLPYIILCFLEKRKNLPKLRTLYEIFWLIEASVLWGSLQFILFFGSLFLLWLDFFPGLFIVFNALSLLVLILVLMIGLWFLQQIKLNKMQKIWELIKYVFFSFTFMGPLLLILNGLPALHAQFLILIGKPLGKFNVTKKYR